MSNPVGWFEIYVNDMARARAFYEKVLGVTLSKLESPAMSDVEMWTFAMNFEQYGATGALVKMNGMTAGANSVLVYFSCKDCAEEASRVAAAGGRVFKPKFSIGENGFIALATDTEGNMFGLHSMA